MNGAADTLITTCSRNVQTVPGVAIGLSHGLALRFLDTGLTFFIYHNYCFSLLVTELNDALNEDLKSARFITAVEHNSSTPSLPELSHEQGERGREKYVKALALRLHLPGRSRDILFQSPNYHNSAYARYTPAM